MQTTKTKWQPIHCYNPVATNSINLIYARYDFKSGLYEFKTQTIAKRMYSTDLIRLKYDTQNILDELKQKDKI